MNILIGADIVPTKSNIEFFESGNVSELLDTNLQVLMNNAEYRILNLEVPLTDTITPIQKCGPNLIASTKSVNGLKNMKIDLLTLANNHILDQGEQGLESTLNILNKNEIGFSGAGVNLEKAARPHVFEISNKKIGVYCCAEHEFSIATSYSAGANPFDPLESLDHISELKKGCDYVIVLYHGGKEQYRYPSPLLQKTCRKIIDKGADLVICQHTHCIGCEEKWDKGTIVYGQGNFLFDNSDNEFWSTSLLIKITDDFNIEYIPLMKDKEKVRLANIDEKKDIMAAFKNRSIQIKDSDFLIKEYEKFSEIMIKNYMLTFSMMNARNVFVRLFNKITGHKFLDIRIKKYYKKKRYVIRNFVECEAHRELLLEGLEKKSHE